jgi:hypothetical protein
LFGAGPARLAIRSGKRRCRSLPIDLSLVALKLLAQPLGTHDEQSRQNEEPKARPPAEAAAQPPPTALRLEAVQKNTDICGLSWENVGTTF